MVKGRPKRRVALVTGGTSGIGRAAAAGLAREGFEVVLLARDPERGTEVARGIRAQVQGASVRVLEGDLASLGSVRTAAANFREELGRLDVLVNSAGVFLPERSVTEDGFERTFATNYLGMFLLVNLLLPPLQAAKGRVVVVASRYGNARIDFDDLQFERRKFSYLKAVPQSKLAQVLFVQELAERLRGTGVTVNAVHPGLVAGTKLLGQTGGFFRWVTDRLGGTPEQGADTVLWLATSEEGGQQSGLLWAKRKPLKTPGQGSDPDARRRLWETSERLASIRPGKRVAA